jgi:hypothetical protein
MMADTACMASVARKKRETARAMNPHGLVK